MRCATDRTYSCVLGVRHVEAGAAPADCVRLAVLRREQVLLVGEARVVLRPREGHEPDPRCQAEFVDVLCGLSHPRFVWPIRPVSREVPPRPVALHAGLPAVVDLDHREPERHKVLPGELGTRRQIPLIRGPGMVPGAIDRRLRRQLDLIVPRDRIGICFQPQPGIGEVPDQQRLGVVTFLPALSRSRPIIELCVHDDLVVLDIREQQAAPPLVRDPSRDKSGPALGIGHGQKRVAPGIGFPTDAGCPRRPQCPQRIRLLLEAENQAHGTNTGHRHVRIGVIGHRGLEDEKRQPRKEHQTVRRSGVVIDLDRLPSPQVGCWTSRRRARPLRLGQGPSFHEREVGIFRDRRKGHPPRIELHDQRLILNPQRAGRCRLGPSYPSTHVIATHRISGNLPDHTSSPPQQ